MAKNRTAESNMDIHKQNVAAYFSRVSNYWASAYAPSGEGAGSFNAYAKQRRMELVLDVLERHAGSRRLALLDVGCGPGLFLEEAARRGHEVHGIDISGEMVQKANGRLSRQVAGKSPCARGDIEELPFESGSMDAVLCLGVLPYLRDDGRALAEIGRVVKSGGIVIMILPNLVKLGNLLDPYYYLVRGWQYLWHRLTVASGTADTSMDPARFGRNCGFGIRRYTSWQVTTLFSSHLLRVEERTGIDFGPFTFWRRQVLPDRVSIAMSKLMAGVARLPLFSWVTGTANEWVFAITVEK